MAWTYEGYWAVVIGDDKDAETVIEDLVYPSSASLESWLENAEDRAWKQGRSDTSEEMPEEWTDFYHRALAALFDASERSGLPRSTWLRR